MRSVITAALLIFFTITGIVSEDEDDIIEIETEGSYRMETGLSIDLAEKLAFFIAKRKAVDLAGRYLSRKRLIDDLKNLKRVHEHDFGLSITN